MNEELKKIIKKNAWSMAGLLIGFGIWDFITKKEFSVSTLLTRLVVAVVLYSVFVIIEYKSNKSK